MYDGRRVPGISMDSMLPATTLAVIQVMNATNIIAMAIAMMIIAATTMAGAALSSAVTSPAAIVDEGLIAAVFIAEGVPA